MLLFFYSDCCPKEIHMDMNNILSFHDFYYVWRVISFDFWYNGPSLLLMWVLYCKCFVFSFCFLTFFISFSFSLYLFHSIYLSSSPSYRIHRVEIVPTFLVIPRTVTHSLSINICYFYWNIYGNMYIAYSVSKPSPSHSTTVT